ncbi:MAG: hypothetical protein AABX33_07445 [Nanoarchaeota archaeon]
MSLDEWVKAIGNSSQSLTLADGRHILLSPEHLAIIHAPRINKGHPLLAVLDPRTKEDSEPIVVKLGVDSEIVPKDVLEGRVRSFFPERGFGFVGDDEQQYYFRSSSIIDGQIVNRGTSVAYRITDSRNGLVAVDISPSFSPKPMSNSGTVHSISRRFGTIIGDDGTPYAISKSDAYNLSSRFKYGMKVAFNHAESVKGQEAKAIVIVPGTNPTYFGFVRYSWSDGRLIVDAVDSRQYRTEHKLAEGVRISFQLDGNKPLNLQQVDSFPFGKYLGAILTYYNNKGWGYIVSNNVSGKLFFHRDDITLTSHEYFSESRISEGEAVRFDVVGDRRDARASRVVPSGTEAAEYITRGLTGTVESYTPESFREEARGLIKQAGFNATVPFNRVADDGFSSYSWRRQQVKPGTIVKYDEVRAGRHAHAFNVRIIN